MRTVMMLLAQYERPLVPLADVVRDYFPHVSLQTWLVKHRAGEIDLTVVEAEPGNRKSAQFVHVDDLAKWVEDRRADGRAEMERTLR